MHHIIVVGGGAGGLELVTRLDQAQKKVADVANEWGFWHLGQLAKGYQNWFGELPSDTCARSHGTNPRDGGRSR